APRAFQPENALSAHAVTTTILPHYAHVYCILPRDNLQVNFSSFPRFIEFPVPCKFPKPRRSGTDIGNAPPSIRISNFASAAESESPQQRSSVPTAAAR
ncbi:MAG: hypothetical protein PUD50_13700, partial [Eubacteriales bacterium]|nr:hypothetical protein [Eubacteriales bacterium]